MYKILIIDDEKNIVNGLAKGLEQNEELDLQIYTASTAVEGLRIVKGVKLDILCSDISMPVMNGFEFSERVRDYWRDCKIIYLTGYDSFDYIYTAVNRFNGKYLLKNEAEERLVELIKGCIEEIQAEWKAREAQIKLAEMENQNRSYQKHLAVNEYISSSNPEQDLERVAKILSEEGRGILAQRELFLVLGELLEGADRADREKNVYQAAIRTAQDYGYFFKLDFVRIFGNSYLFFIQTREEESGEEHSRGLLQNLLEQMQSLLLDSYGEKLSLVYANKPLSIVAVKDQIKFYSALLHSRLLKSRPVLVETEEIMESMSEEAGMAWEDSLQIDRMLMEKKYSALKAVFESLYISIKKTTELSMMDTRMYYSALGSMSAYIENNIRLDDMPRNLQQGYYHLRYMTGIDEIQEYLIQLLEYLAENDLEETSEDSRLVQKLEDYVMEHITEEVTLNKLAHLVYFNPSYLSRFYKNETGRNLSAFIKEARIIKAKELLKNTDKKVGDIAKILGYESVSYFNVIFKKTVGVTPGEYRSSPKI